MPDQVGHDGTVMTFNSFIIQTVWLTQDQMKTLFQRDKSVISRHIRDIFNEGELDPEVVVAKNATTTRHGAIADKTQTHEKLVYNLDVIISVGYCVKSKRGTQFRIWATSVLKEYLIKGYAVRSRDLHKQSSQSLDFDVHPKSWTVNNRFLHVLSSVLHRTQSV